MRAWVLALIAISADADTMQAAAVVRTVMRTLQQQALSWRIAACYVAQASIHLSLSN
jgi:hypothetical protein